MVDARVMGFDDHDVALLIAAHAFGLSYVRLRHLPGADENAVRRKLLHPAGHIGHVKLSALSKATDAAC